MNLEQTLEMNLEQTLENQGLDLTKQIIEFPSSALNQIFVKGPFAGYSIRDLLKIYINKTGQTIKETKDKIEGE